MSKRHNIDASYRIARDRKSTRLNSSHSQISYAAFCLKQTTHQTAHATVRKARERMKSHTDYLCCNTKSCQQSTDLTDQVAQQATQSAVTEGSALVRAM